MWSCDRRADVLRRFMLGVAGLSLAAAAEACTGVPLAAPVGLLLGWFDAATSDRDDWTGLGAIVLGVLFDSCLLRVTPVSGWWAARLVASVLTVVVCVVGIMADRRGGRAWLGR